MVTPKATRLHARVRQAGQYTIEQLEPRMLMAAVSWTGLGDGVNWTDAVNWSSNPSLPGPADDVTISVVANPTISLAGTQSINSLVCDENLTVSGSLAIAASSTQTATLTMSNGTLTANGNLAVNTLIMPSGTVTGSEDLTITGTSSLWTGGTMSGTGKTTVPSGTAMTIGGAGNFTVTLARVLEASGTLTLSSSGSPATTNLNMTGGTINVLSGATATFTVSGLAPAFIINDTSGTNLLSNAGTMNTNSTSDFPLVINVPFSNTGTVNVQTQTTTLTIGGTYGGTFSISSGATLRFPGGTNSFSSATVGGAGMIDVTAGSMTFASDSYSVGTTRISGAGTVATFNAAASTSLTFSDGTLNGTGDLTLTGTGSTWTGGTMSGTGKTTVPSGTAMTIGGAGNFTVTLARVLEASGTLTLSSSGSPATTNLNMTGGTINVLSGATATFTVSGLAPAFIINDTSGTNLLSNAGTMNTNSTSDFPLVINVPFSNTGVVNVQSGTTTLTAVGTYSGLFGISSGSTMRLDAAAPTLNAALAISSGGTLRFDGGAHTLGVGSAVSGAGSLNVNAGSLTFAAGSYNVGTTNVNGASTVVAFDAAASCGALGLASGTVTGSANLTLTGTGSMWTGGTMTGTGTTIIASAAALNITGVGTRRTDRPLQIIGSASMQTGGNLVLVVTESLIINPGANMNMADNAVIVDYTAKDGDPLTEIKGYLTSGYNNGAWNGPGINSSVAATTPGRALGYAESSALFSTFPAIFAGQQVDNTAVLIRYTRYGDANLTGNTNLDDFNRLATSFGLVGAVWSQGNFNYDNVTNLNDFNLLASNFGQSAAPARGMMLADRANEEDSLNAVT